MQKLWSADDLCRAFWGPRNIFLPINPQGSWCNVDITVTSTSDHTLTHPAWTPLPRFAVCYRRGGCLASNLLVDTGFLTRYHDLKSSEVRSFLCAYAAWILEVSAVKLVSSYELAEKRKLTIAHYERRNAAFSGWLVLFTSPSRKVFCVPSWMGIIFSTVQVLILV